MAGMTDAQRTAVQKALEGLSGMEAAIQDARGLLNQTLAVGLSPRWSVSESNVQEAIAAYDESLWQIILTVRAMPRYQAVVTAHGG